MCDTNSSSFKRNSNVRTIPVSDAVGTVLAHDITEIRTGEFKGRAFKKGHVVREEDVCHLKRLGKENLFVLNIVDDEMHENDAAYALAGALKGPGVTLQGEPSEGKINLLAEMDGILKVNKDALYQFNLLDDVMCASLHSNTVVKKGQIVAGTRAIPLVVKKDIINHAVQTANKNNGSGVIEVRKLRKPRTGVVVTGNEVYYGRIKDAFAPIITEKIKAFDGEMLGIYYAPDETDHIEERLRELLNAGADLIITTGGMSVDPDDVTRFAIKNLGATDLHYGASVLPGAMILVGYIGEVPIIGVPACGLHHRTTVFDLILPRILGGERIGHEAIAELGHGGLCLHCKECVYPVCPFGK